LNQYQPETLVLNADVPMEEIGEYFTPIGLPDTPFRGSFQPSPKGELMSTAKSNDDANKAPYAAAKETMWW
jgi:hypothetical protein